jgi:hypothetical protein
MTHTPHVGLVRFLIVVALRIQPSQPTQIKITTPKGMKELKYFQSQS